MNNVLLPVLSKGDVKSKVTKSAKFGGGRWQVSHLARPFYSLQFQEISGVRFIINHDSYQHTAGRSYFMRIRVLHIPLRTSVAPVLVGM